MIDDSTRPADVARRLYMMAAAAFSGEGSIRSRRDAQTCAQAARLLDRQAPAKQLWIGGELGAPPTVCSPFLHVALLETAALFRTPSSLETRGFNEQWICTFADGYPTNILHFAVTITDPDNQPHRLYVVAQDVVEDADLARFKGAPYIREFEFTLHDDATESDPTGPESPA